MEDLNPNAAWLKVRGRGTPTIWRAPCGCSEVERGDRLDYEPCSLGATIEQMVTFAYERMITARSHAEHLRWSALYHQRADFRDAHTGGRYDTIGGLRAPIPYFTDDL